VPEEEEEEEEEGRKEFLHTVFFPLGNYQASEFYMPTFRNTLFHLHLPAYEVGKTVSRNVGI